MPKFVDMTGQKYNMLTAIELDRIENGRTYWKFRCDCGNEVVADGSKVRYGTTKSCGCYRKTVPSPKRADLLGTRFGRLVVVKDLGSNEIGHALWLCKCDCGNEYQATTNHLHFGNINSCGCLKLEGNNKKHGQSESRIYQTYRGMKDRCFNKNSVRYETHGARGISICDEWLGKDGFENFYKWAMENGYREDLTIDRIDNDGNYEPSNCRWADNITQCNNKTTNVLVTYDGETHTVAEWARIVGIKYGTLYARLFRRHWEVERALTEEIHDFM